MVVYISLSDLFGWKNKTSLFYDFTLTHAGRTYQSKGEVVFYDIGDGELFSFVSTIMIALGDELAEEAEDTTGAMLAQMLQGAPIEPLSIIESPAVLNCRVLLLHNSTSSTTSAQYKPDTNLSPAHITDWLINQFLLLSGCILEDFYRASFDRGIRLRHN